MLRYLQKLTQQLEKFAIQHLELGGFYETLLHSSLSVLFYS